MKIDSLNKINKKSTLQRQPVQLKDMLSTILNAVENFEQNGKINFKGHKERMEILKSFITEFIKDDEQKRIISGGQ